MIIEGLFKYDSQIPSKWSNGWEDGCAKEKIWKPVGLEKDSRAEVCSKVFRELEFYRVCYFVTYIESYRAIIRFVR